MKAQAIPRSNLSPDVIDGAVLAHTLEAQENHHRVIIPKGRILSREDWRLVLQANPTELHIVRMELDEVHEDEAATELARMVAGEGIAMHGPTESQMRLSAGRNGILEIDVDRLNQLNGVPDLSIFTLFDGQLVSEGKTVAGVKVTPFVVPRSRLEQAKEICSAGPVIRILAFRPMRVAVLVRERLGARAREKFQESIEMKVAWFGSTISSIEYVADDSEAVEACLTKLVRQADLVLTAGANATDPLDPTLLALLRMGGRMEKQGAPAHPGSAVWLAYWEAVPIFGVAACGMFSKSTVLDLILPRLFTGKRVTAEDFNRLGHGGLLSRDMSFRFPNYGISATEDD
jgi:hypothetical protein